MKKAVLVCLVALLGMGTSAKAQNAEKTIVGVWQQYVSRQVARVDIAQRDSLFLRTKILEMYANPLANYLQAQGL